MWDEFGARQALNSCHRCKVYHIYALGNTYHIWIHKKAYMKGFESSPNLYTLSPNLPKF